MNLIGLIQFNWTIGGKSVGEREIDALLIQPGDVLKIIPGSKVPVDGVVVWGSSYVSESMVTGESTPVLKEVDSSVIGGTMNLHGSLHVKATKVGSDRYSFEPDNLSGGNSTDVQSSHSEVC